MNKSLAELIYISRKVGKDHCLTQGSSGNTSVKTQNGKFMFVKTSGTALKDMNTKRGWCKVSLQKVRKIGDKKIAKLSPKKREIEIAERLIAACEDKKNQPSIESNLHAFLDKYVIHLHPIMVCAFLITKNGKAELKKLFARERPAPLWVPYANPGYALAKKIAKLTIGYRKKYRRLPQILFLEKHGLFVSAASAKEALKLVGKVIKRCETKIKDSSPRRRLLNYDKIIALCRCGEANN
ncbi:MAG: class II aldolase/adducin family protein [Sedimentisphaerales bacterium]